MKTKTLDAILFGASTLAFVGGAYAIHSEAAEYKAAANECRMNAYETGAVESEKQAEKLMELYAGAKTAEGIFVMFGMLSGFGCIARLAKKED